MGGTDAMTAVTRSNDFSASHRDKQLEVTSNVLGSVGSSEDHGLIGEVKTDEEIRNAINILEVDQKELNRKRQVEINNATKQNFGNLDHLVKNKLTPFGYLVKMGFDLKKNSVE